jgi:2-oxoglutarate ferredoxin oxidoreductase subunit alpha
MLMIEGNIDAAKLIPILHYDGTPITARFIRSAIADRAAALKVVPFAGAAAE